MLPLCLNAETAERKLAEINATIAIPADWKVDVQNDDGVIVYQLAGKATHPCLSITVTPDVKDRTQMRPTQYANELLSALKELGGQLEKKDAVPFVQFQVTYSSEGEDEQALSITDTALANDETGVLYFLTWQAPALDDKSDANKSLRGAILSSFKPDPKFAATSAATEDEKKDAEQKEEFKGESKKEETKKGKFPKEEEKKDSSGKGKPRAER